MLSINLLQTSTTRALRTRETTSRSKGMMFSAPVISSLDHCHVIEILMPRQNCSRTHQAFYRESDSPNP